LDESELLLEPLDESEELEEESEALEESESLEELSGKLSSEESSLRTLRTFSRSKVSVLGPFSVLRAKRR
jgi:hypothetical protein